MKMPMIKSKVEAPNGTIYAELEFNNDGEFVKNHGVEIHLNPDAMEQFERDIKKTLKGKS